MYVFLACLLSRLLKELNHHTDFRHFSKLAFFCNSIKQKIDGLLLFVCIKIDDFSHYKHNLLPYINKDKKKGGLL